jgi:hypothetical protein
VNQQLPVPQYLLSSGYIPYVAITPQALTLPLLRGTTILEAALKQEENILFDLAYPE